MSRDPITTDHANDVSVLVKALDHVMKRLQAYVVAHGPLSDREDETFAFGAIALQMARSGDMPLVDEHDMLSANLAIVPLDDEERGFSDSALSEEVVAAGMEALETSENDLREYVSGITPDWDHGMVAVAVYRAMVRAARLRRFFCRHGIGPSDSWTEIRATDQTDAVRTFSHREFDESQGEWMGGTVFVTENPDIGPIFETAYDVDIAFDETEQRNLRAFVNQIRPSHGEDSALEGTEA